MRRKTRIPEPPKNETRAQRRKRLRAEYKDALDDFNSYSRENVTREYRRAQDRLDKAERALAWWRR